MKLVLNDSADTFKSSENFDSSSFTKKISKNSSYQSIQKNNKNENNEKNDNTNNNINITNKIQQQNTNLTNNKNISINIGNILENKKSIAKLMKNIFTRVLYINNTLQSYELFLDKLSPTDFKFYDNQFPPNLNSLIKGYKSSSKNNKNKIPLEKYKNIIWKRESELNFFPETNIFPKNGIFLNSKNIVKGPYTNNNFLSAIIALTRYPELIKKLFLSEIKNKNGIFGLKICKNGFLQEIVIDDFFPVLKPSFLSINSDPEININANITYPYCFTHSRDNTLWTQVLEKAYAKVYGSYEILYKKDIEDILKDLSFAPILELDSLSSDLALNLTLANENKWIVMASAGDTDASQNLLKELDLMTDFNYEILEVFKLGIDDLTKLNYIQMNNLENVQIILKIRNIWGKIDWDGEWSNSYKFWDDDLKKKLHYDPDDEQVFYMNLRDFKNHFFKVKSCKLLENSKYKSIKIRQNPNDYVLIKLDIHKPKMFDITSNCFISLIQEEKFNNNYLIGRMILCKIKDAELKEVEYIRGIMGQEKEIFIEQNENLSGGEYLLYCELDKNNNNINYIVSVYSSEEVDIEEIDNKSYQNILDKIYISCAKKKKLNLNSSSDDMSVNDDYKENNNNNYNRRNSFKKIKIKNASKIEKYTENTLEGFSYIYIENKEKDATLIENVNYHNFEGYELLPPYSGTSFYVEVKPGERKIILIKRLELIDSNNIEVFYRSNILYGNKTLYTLTKRRGRKKKRIDKKNGKKVNINVYIYKHDFGICFLYRNKTNNMLLTEKVNIENNTNIEFSDENKENNQKKEIKIMLEPHKDYFLNLKSRHFLWKVNPVFSYTIDIIQNQDNEEDEKSDSNSLKGEFNNFFVDKRKINRIRSMSPYSIKVMKTKRNNHFKKNPAMFGNYKENDIEENEDSSDNNGDSSDINISDENSDESV